MVGRPGQYQFSFLAGELAPAVWGNTGLKQFYAGLSQAINIEPVPQGGFRLLPRTRYRAEIPLVKDLVGIAAVRFFRFTVSRANAYMVVLTDRLATIFKNGVFETSFATPYIAADLAVLKFTQRFDTMFIFHAKYATGRILHVSGDATWTYDLPVFTNIPSVQLAGTYVNTVEKWIVLIQWANANGFTPAGGDIVLSIGGQETDVATIGSPTFTGDLLTRIQALPTVDTGVTLVNTGSNASAAYYELDFAGANAGANFIVSGRCTNEVQISVTTWRQNIGILGGEPLFSSTAGYAAAGGFYQDRLVTAGFLSKTSAFLASRTGEYFDSNIKIPTAASAALLINLDTDGGEAIINVVQSKHLCFFTTEADYFVSDRALAATTAPNIVRSSTYGCSKRVIVQPQESGLLYMNREETILYAATYDAVSDAYVSAPLSLLSSHLVFATRDAALQNSFTATDSQRFWIARDDGGVVVALLIRNQDVSPFVQWKTDGLVRSVGVDGANTVYLAIERTVGGAQHLYIETIEEGLLLDCAVTITNAVAINVITGLGVHEGAKVWALVDGYVEGPFTVAGGTITTQFAGLSITVGRWTPPLAQTLPLVRDVAPHTVLKRPARVHTMVLDLINTTSLAVGANGQPVKDVPLITVLQPTDQPPVPVTQQKTISGLAGFSPYGQTIITQVRPGQLQMRDMTIEAKI